MPRSNRPPRRPTVKATVNQPTTTAQPLPPQLQWPAPPQPDQLTAAQPPQPVAPLQLHTSSTAQPHHLHHQPMPHQLPPAPPLSAYQGAAYAQPQQLPQVPESGQRLATFPRGPSTELRVNWASFNGHPFLSLRVWCQLPDGRWVPDSRRGCTVKLRELEGFAQAVQLALDTAAQEWAG